MNTATMKRRLLVVVVLGGGVHTGAEKEGKGGR